MQKEIPVNPEIAKKIKDYRDIILENTDKYNKYAEFATIHRMQLREFETLCEEAYKKSIEARKYLRDIVLSSTGFSDAEWVDDRNTLLVNVPDPESKEVIVEKV